MNINKRHSKLKSWCYKTPNASYTEPLGLMLKRLRKMTVHYKNNSMIKLFFVRAFLLLFIISIPQAGFSQKADANAFVELSAGYGFGTSIIIYAGQVALEVKPAKTKSISFNFEFNFNKSNGGLTINNPGGSSSYPIIVYENTWSANILWHPIRTEKQPYSWLFLGAGTGYYEQKFGDYLSNHGPILRGTVGLQHIFLKKISLTAKFQVFYFYNMNMDDPARIKFTGLPLTISLGYRFTK